VTRTEIIAAIDTEIERLQRARSLIVQSAAGKRSADLKRKLSIPAKQAKGQPPVQAGKAIASLQTVQPSVARENTQMLITRLPAKQPPRRRTARVATKQGTALTGTVPQGPVAVSAKNREASPATDDKTVSGTPLPSSAFGLAVARGLASLGAS
jgi:hypothetical protein